MRPQPWTDDDSGLMFQTCQRCGNLSIQRFAASGSVSGVWMLSANAMVLFRAGAPPAKVFDYVFSDDFSRNRGITQGLFRGYVGHMHDLSGVANTLISRIDAVTDATRVEVCVEALRDVLVEYLHRAQQDDTERLSVATVEPIASLMRGRRPLDGGTVEGWVNLRLQALEILELFAQPALWNSLPPHQAQQLEDEIDHGSMVEESIAALNGFTVTQMDEVIVRRIAAEARFFFRVFRRRKARLSRAHSGALWQAMRRLREECDVGNPLDPATMAYEASRQLLEHQLVESGFLKLGNREVDGDVRTAFRSPNTGEVLHVPEHRPSLEIFATSRTEKPTARLDSWTSALDRL